MAYELDNSNIEIHHILKVGAENTGRFLKGSKERHWPESSLQLGSLNPDITGLPKARLVYVVVFHLRGTLSNSALL